MSSYITSEQLKSTLSLTGTTYADADVAAAITAASRAIDAICNRRFYVDASDATRYYRPNDDRASVDIDDLVSLTTLQTDSGLDQTWADTWASTDYALEPVNAQADATLMWPYTSIRVRPTGQFVFPVANIETVKVVGKFGWPQLPDAVTQATTMVATRFLVQARQAPLGIVPFEGGAIRIAKRDAQVMALIGNLIRHRVATG